MVNVGRPKKAAKEKRDKKLVGYATEIEKQEVSDYVHEHGGNEANIVREAVLDWVRRNKKK